MDHATHELIDRMMDGAQDFQANLNDRYTPEEVSAGLDVITAMLNEYVGVITDRATNSRFIAGRNIAMYVEFLISRLRDWTVMPCDALAWTTRNILEVHFWTERVATSEPHATSFLSEEGIDQSELFELYINSLQHDEHTGETELIRQLAAQNTGKRVKVKTPEAILHKECSKFIHPTAWLIHNFDQRMSDQFARLKFVAFSLHYLSHIALILLRSNPDTSVLVAGITIDS